MVKNSTNPFTSKNKGMPRLHPHKPSTLGSRSRRKTEVR
ncbi:hypothetical protein M7I_4080 [Glarea lozoyensis 74030]|uniref:Uncharacterized protein n=1 Tax=Glarea lozoyensis (strain ATCC 74030 / MF5533) TaxID=1104152 RepID=H0EN77_GLAL7|nr:hypothetical protein M7I_4080 [Glarea lozoyensis 74030]